MKNDFDEKLAKIKKESDELEKKAEDHQLERDKFKEERDRIREMHHSRMREMDSGFHPPREFTEHTADVEDDFIEFWLKYNYGGSIVEEFMPDYGLGYASYGKIRRTEPCFGNFRSKSEYIVAFDLDKAPQQMVLPYQIWKYAFEHDEKGFWIYHTDRERPIKFIFYSQSMGYILKVSPLFLLLLAQDREKIWKMNKRAYKYLILYWEYFFGRYKYEMDHLRQHNNHPVYEKIDLDFTFLVDSDGIHEFMKKVSRARFMHVSFLIDEAWFLERDDIDRLDGKNVIHPLPDVKTGFVWRPLFVNGWARDYKRQWKDTKMIRRCESLGEPYYVGQPSEKEEEYHAYSAQFRKDMLNIYECPFGCEIDEPTHFGDFKIHLIKNASRGAIPKSYTAREGFLLRPIPKYSIDIERYRDRRDLKSLSIVAFYDFFREEFGDDPLFVWHDGGTMFFRAVDDKEEVTDIYVLNQHMNLVMEGLPGSMEIHYNLGNYTDGGRFRVFNMRYNEFIIEDTPHVYRNLSHPFIHEVSDILLMWLFVANYRNLLRLNIDLRIGNMFTHDRLCDGYYQTPAVYSNVKGLYAFNPETGKYERADEEKLSNYRNLSNHMVPIGEESSNPAIAALASLMLARENPELLEDLKEAYPEEFGQEEGETGEESGTDDGFGSGTEILRRDERDEIAKGFIDPNEENVDDIEYYIFEDEDEERRHFEAASK